jgi:hypothetical protein
MKPIAICLLLAACSKSPSSCKPGESGCACVQDGCNAGLICVANMCSGENTAGLGVDGHARSCEVLLQEGKGGKVDHLDFGNGVTGRWLRQGDKVAAAFLSDRDAPIGAVQVVYAGGFSITKSHCYGARGEELAGATVHR